MPLLQLNGGPEVIKTARELFKGGPKGILSLLDSLNELLEVLGLRIPNLEISIDLAELRGYRYHSSTTFSAYIASSGRAIAWGGRYGTENSNGYRSATGFSADLKTLLEFGDVKTKTASLILAPVGNEKDLLDAIEHFRAQGKKVVQSLFEHMNEEAEVKFDRRLIEKEGKWIVEDC